MKSGRRLARIWGIAFILFGLGALALDFAGALRGENKLSIQIAEVVPAGFGLILLVLGSVRP